MHGSKGGVAQAAADLASAAAVHMNSELAHDVNASARKAKLTMRDQLLEAAYHLAVGNVPIKVENGWLVKSKSNFVGKLLRVTTQYDVSMPIGNATMEFVVDSGKTYWVSEGADQCTCDKGCMPGYTCEHMVRVEFYREAMNGQGS